MSWPLSHDFNEAIQNPRIVFTDPDLKGGEAVVGATGLPLPRSGNASPMCTKCAEPTGVNGQ